MHNRTVNFSALLMLTRLRPATTNRFKFRARRACEPQVRVTWYSGTANSQSQAMHGRLYFQFYGCMSFDAQLQLIVDAAHCMRLYTAVRTHAVYRTGSWYSLMRIARYTGLNTDSAALWAGHYILPLWFLMAAQQSNCGFRATVYKTVSPICYRWVVLSVCLSCLSVPLVYCGQTVGRMKMKLSTQVGLSPRHIVLEGDPAPFPKQAQPPIFSPYLLRPNG